MNWELGDIYDDGSRGILEGGDLVGVIQLTDTSREHMIIDALNAFLEGAR
ncbi:hypothetical protein [Corynebacterium sp. CNJ-954]|nr:hypothetical protein [Corynebacterium sp. CNJ-954]